MTGDTQPSSTVLVVEDERKLADFYAKWLSEAHEVLVAYSGKAAIQLFDESVDVVLLDRRMPDTTGDEVLEHIRSSSSDPGVAMVTAVKPSVDVVSMGFDEYVVKPVDKEELLSLTETLLRRAEHDEAMRRHYRIASKITLLEENLSGRELAASEEYTRLQEELDAIDDELSVADELSAEDVGALLRSTDGEQ